MSLPQASRAVTGTTLFARYRVIDACGSGGFGTVLICWDTRLQRRVAIKRIPTSVTGEAAATMSVALSEARTASLLAHGGIVAVYDFESDADYAYLVMEYVDGMSLATLLQRVEGGTLTADETAYVVSSVASALSHAHANGVLHLDIKPANVMINVAGAIKLCDFGVATLASAAGYGGARGGTVGYMPPEQVEGEMVDERTDVFALAVIAWEMLCGSNPFAAPSAEASLKLMRRGPRSKLSRVAPDASPAVDAVMAAALAPNPAARTPSVTEFAESLVAALGSVEAGARSVSALLAQATDDEKDEGALISGLPLALRHPRLPEALTRGVAALVTGAVVQAPALFLLGHERAWAAPLVVVAAAALAALVPSAGALLAGMVPLAALAVTAEGADIMLPGVAAILLVAWWLSVARRDRHATSMLLVPVVLRAPAAVSALAGAFLPPLRGALTTCFVWLAANLLEAAAQSGFNASAASASLVARMASAVPWASMAGAAATSAVIAALTRASATTTGAVAAQVVGATALAVTQLAAASVENGGNVVAPTWSTVGVAVVLCVATSAVVASGGAGVGGEGEA